MISGSKFGAILAVAFAVLAISMPVKAHDAEAYRLLMQEFSEVKKSRVAYSEVKTLSILDEPIRQSGIFEYIAPDKVVREIRDPQVESYTIVGELMVAVRGGIREEVDLDSVPLLASFIEAFRATLSGRTATLEQYYEIDFRNDDPNWELLLQPRDRSLARVIASIRFNGSGVQITQIVINEANGDHSEMQLTALIDED